MNTTIIMKAEEEIALPLREKKNKLNHKDFFDYFGVERLGLSESILKNELLNFEKALPLWKEWLKMSFLSENMRALYEKLIEERWKRLSAWISTEVESHKELDAAL